MIPIPYNCKYCGLEGVAECHVDCPEIDKQKWLPLLCCDRCGDYQAWLRRVFTTLANWGREWSLKGESGKTAVRVATRQSLEELTRKVCDVVCRFYRVDFAWSAEFVDELLHQPARAPLIVRAYEAEIARQARIIRIKI